MNPVVLLDNKRLGRSLADDEIRFLIDGFTAGDVPDYQMSAFAMAVCFHGMNPAETLALTRAMLASGRTMTWRPGPPVVDKHSTGGIGDKSSLVLAPLLAGCGVRVPMLSGRGLGATGGTLDKLESIPGFRTDLPLAEMQRQVDEIGCAMIGQTSEICPADRKLYALRDATATVASIPLITASILCKKLAEGLDALVLDVKYGTGAFMRTKPEAEALAESMQRVLDDFGLRGVVRLNPMEQPTGRTVGNALEVNECLAIMDGGGPADLRELVFDLAAALLCAAGIAPNESAARARLASELSSGRARAKFDEMVRRQGGRLDGPLPVADSVDFVADRSGRFEVADASQIGYALTALGGGRTKVADRIDHAVGFEFLVRIGDRVKAGDPLVRMFVRDRGQDEATARLRSAIRIS